MNSCIAAQRAQIDTTLVVPVPPHAASRVESVLRRLLEEGIRVLTFDPMPWDSYYANRWAVSPRLAAWVSRHSGRYDLVHLHAAWGFSQLFGLLAAVSRGQPCVLTPHEALTSFDIREANHYVRPAAKSVVKNLYMRHATLIVFSSALEVRDSLAVSNTSQAVVLHHPLRDALEAPRVISRSVSGPPRIGFLGRFHEKKNLEVLIRAVHRTSREAQLVIAGDGPADYKSRLRSLVANLDMTDRIKWVGFVEGRRKWAFLDSLDILAMPSAYECFGMVAAEAMARGTATVASRNTGVAELIEATGGGLIAAPTVPDFGAALAELIDHPSRAADVARRGERAAREALSLEAHGHAIRRYYEQALNSAAHAHHSRPATSTP